MALDALFLQTLLNGVMVGGIYVMLAIGFSLAYGVMHVIDFAVGAWIMLGSFLAFFLSSWLKVDPLLLIPVVWLFFTGVGYLVQPLIGRAVSGKVGKPALMGLVFTFGMALVIQGAALTAFGFNNRSLTSGLSSSYLQLGSMTLPTLRVLALAFAVVVNAVLFYMLRYTDFGLSVRAIAVDKVTPGLMGVNVDKVNKQVYALYTGITAATGVFVGLLFNINAQMGGQYTVFAFFVVVLAGLGYLPGVFAAALILGLVQAFFSVYFNPSYTMLIVFLGLYLVLLLSPRGLFRKGV